MAHIDRLDRRALLGRMLAGAFVAAAGASLPLTPAEAVPFGGAIADGALPEPLVEEAATTCWWSHGRRVCTRRPARRVCWWSHGRRVCTWR